MRSLVHVSALVVAAAVGAAALVAWPGREPDEGAMAMRAAVTLGTTAMQDAGAPRGVRLATGGSLPKSPATATTDMGFRAQRQPLVAAQPASAATMLAARRAKIESECLRQLAGDGVPDEQRAQRCRQGLPELQRRRLARLVCHADEDCVAVKDPCGRWQPLNVSYKAQYERESSEAGSDACRFTPAADVPAPAYECDKAQQRCGISLRRER